MTSSTQELLDHATPRSIEVSVCARGDLVDAHDRLERQLTSQRSPDQGSLAGSAAPDITEIARQVRDLEDQIADASLTYTVTSIGRRAWADLKRQHPPTRDEAKKGLDTNMATFPQAAIARCCSPEITLEQSERLTEVLPEGEWTKLWTAVLGVNLGVMDTPKSGVAAAILRLSENSGAS